MKSLLTANKQVDNDNSYLNLKPYQKKVFLRLAFDTNKIEKTHASKTSIFKTNFAEKLKTPPLEMKLKSLEFDFIWYVSKTFRQNENIDAKLKKMEIIEKISKFSNFVKFFFREKFDGKTVEQ